MPPASRIRNSSTAILPSLGKVTDHNRRSGQAKGACHERCAPVDANTPVDEHTTRTFAIQMRNFFKFRMFDKGSLKRLEKVLQEDTDIVEETRPFYLAENLDHEVSVKSDRFMSTFRKMRRDLIEKRGWEIDSEEVERHRGKRLFAIPSPARRAALNDGVDPLLDAIPLKPAKVG